MLLAFQIGITVGTRSCCTFLHRPKLYFEFFKYGFKYVYSPHRDVCKISSIFTKFWVTSIWNKMADYGYGCDWACTRKTKRVTHLAVNIFILIRTWCRVLPDGSMCQILLNSESELCKASAAVVDSVGARRLVGKIGVIWLKTGILILHYGRGKCS